MYNPNLSTNADHRTPLSTIASSTSVDVASSSSITPAWTTLQNISLLPNELMAEIFAISCHATSETFPADENRHKQTTPLILGKVCTQWRAITWSRPYIWSHISLCLSTPRYETQVKLLSDWLTRSGVCPLTINLMFERERDWIDTIPIDLIHLLMASANRWRTINFVLPHSWYSTLAKLNYSFPLIVTVISRPLWLECAFSSSIRKRFNLFEFAPQLRNLHLNDYFLSHVDVPWNQLNRLTLESVYLSECFYALVRTPNIRFCHISSILGNDDGLDIAEYSIHLPLLQELSIDNQTWPYVSDLLSEMTVPLLETLKISVLEVEHESDEPYTLIDFFSSQKCLKRMNLLSGWSLVYRESEFVQYLRNIPSLEELEVSVEPSGDPINGLLLTEIFELAEPGSSESDDDHTCLPNLKVFRFSASILVTNDHYDDYLTSLIERRLEYSKECSRTPPISRLNVFEIITDLAYPFAPSLSVKQRLRKLVGEGLQLKVEFAGVSWL